VLNFTLTLYSLSFSPRFTYLKHLMAFMPHITTIIDDVSSRSKNLKRKDFSPFFKLISLKSKTQSIIPSIFFTNLNSNI